MECGDTVPSVFWTVGGAGTKAYPTAKEEARIGGLATEHNRRLGRLLHGTLRARIEKVVAATRPGARRSKAEKSSRATRT